MPEYYTPEKDRTGRTKADYEKVYDSISDETKREIGETLMETVDSYLLSFGDPKQYRNFVNFAGTVSDGLICWLITNEYVTLTEKGQAPDADIERRQEERKKQKELAEKQFSVQDILDSAQEEQAEEKPDDRPVPGMYI